MRLFFAIELSEPFREHLVRVQERLRAEARGKVGWTPAENLHLTLKFLGEVPDGRVAELCEAMRDVDRCGPVELMAERLLCFPPNGRIRIIGAGLRGAPELVSLAERIESTCEQLGFARERRAYRPHITLARARNPLPGGLRRPLDEAAADAWPGPAMPVERFILMESRLSREGPQYISAATFDINLPK